MLADNLRRLSALATLWSEINRKRPPTTRMLGLPRIDRQTNITSFGKRGPEDVLIEVLCESRL